MLQTVDGLILARTLEFTVDAQWGAKLTGALQHCHNPGALRAVAAGARVVGLHVAGAGSLSKVAARLAVVNGGSNGVVACCSSSAADSENMAAQLFVHEDSGHAMH